MYDKGITRVYELGNSPNSRGYSSCPECAGRASDFRALPLELGQQPKGQVT